MAKSMLDVAALKICWEQLTWSAECYATVEKLMADHGVSKRRACRLGSAIGMAIYVATRAG